YKAFSYSSIVRGSSITPNPVIFSSSVLYLTPIILSWFILKYSNNRFILYLIFVCFILTEFVVMFISNSRSFLIFVPIIIVLMLTVFKRYDCLLIFGSMVLLYILVFEAKIGVFERVKEIVLGNDYSSFYNRVDSYKLSFDILRKNIFFGVGLVNFKFYVPYYYGNYLHNLYLSILVETGILGFISFMVLISFLVYNSFLRVIHNFDVSRFGYFISVIFFLIHGFIDNTLYVFSLGAMFWFFVGILFRYRWESKNTI
ncbi:MAG: O-antigen ligase family protein, partial [Brevinematia bacterium]